MPCVAVPMQHKHIAAGIQSGIHTVDALSSSPRVVPLLLRDMRRNISLYRSPTIQMVARGVVKVIVGSTLLDALSTLTQAAGRTDGNSSVKTRRRNVTVIQPPATRADRHSCRIPDGLIAARSLVQEVRLHRSLPGRAGIGAGLGVHGEDEIRAVPSARSTGRAPRPRGVPTLTVARI